MVVDKCCDIDFCLRRSQVAEAGYSEFVQTCRSGVARQEAAWTAHQAAAAIVDGPRRDNAGPLASVLLHLEPQTLGRPRLVSFLL